MPKVATLVYTGSVDDANDIRTHRPKYHQEWQGGFLFNRAQRRQIIASKKPAGLKNPVDTLKSQLLATLEDNKAEDITVISLEGKSALADYMILATGRSSRHVISLGELLGDTLHKLTGRHARYEGRENGDWVLTDCGDVIVHLFRAEVRSYYNLEKMWEADADALPSVPAAARKAAPRKRKVAATA